MATPIAISLGGCEPPPAYRLAGAGAAAVLIRRREAQRGAFPVSGCLRGAGSGFAPFGEAPAIVVGTVAGDEVPRHRRDPGSSRPTARPRA